MYKSERLTYFIDHLVLIYNAQLSSKIYPTTISNSWINLPKIGLVSNPKSASMFKYWRLNDVVSANQQ